MENIKVSSKSNPSSVAGALANIFKEKDQIAVQVVGAGALNQLIKAIIICKGFLAPLGKSVVCIPSFTDINIDQSVKTGIRIVIKLEKN